MSMAEPLRISAQVTVPSGVLEFNDGRIYRLDPTTMASIAVQWRRQQVASPFVPGTFTVNAVKDSIMESVGVYVRGSDNGDMRRKVEALVDAFSQLRYSVTWESDDDYYTWLCEVADYTVDTRREFRHARMATVSFQVPRYPELVRV